MLDDAGAREWSNLRAQHQGSGLPRRALTDTEHDRIPRAAHARPARAPTLPAPTTRTLFTCQFSSAPLPTATEPLQTDERSNAAHDGRPCLRLGHRTERGMLFPRRVSRCACRGAEEKRAR